MVLRFLYFSLFAFLTVVVAIEAILVQTVIPTGSTEVWIVTNPVSDGLALVGAAIIPLEKACVVYLLLICVYDDVLIRSQQQENQ